jgi:hypothetical protein
MRREHIQETVVRESDVELRKAVATANGVTEVTLTITSSQAVPVFVRLFDDVPPGATVVSREAEAGDAPGECPFDRLECHLVLDPGERIAVTYALATGGSEDGEGTTTEVATTDPELTSVVSGSAGDSGRTGPAALWWDGEAVHRVPTARASEDPETWLVGPDADRAAFVTDGGDLEPDTSRQEVREMRAVPAVGLIVTPENHEGALRTVTRARGRGHAVYVTYVDETSESTAYQCESLGAVVVEPPAEELGPLALRAELERRAEADGLPGIFVQPESAPPIDYERTADAFEHAEFGVEAIPETWSDPSDHPHVVVGIPAYNAVGTVGDVVRQAKRYADVVVVVDDGSADDTAKAARDAGALVVEHTRNRGYGGALKTVFKEADRLDAQHLVVLDADGQHDTTDIPRLVEKQADSGASIVVGSRYVGESRTRLPPVRRIGLGVINVLTNFSLGRVRPRDFVHDTQSGYRAYDREAIESLAADPDIGDRMGASTDIIYHAHRRGYDIAEVGTTISYEVEHGSTLNPIAHGYDLVRNIFYTLTVVHPFKTLGVVGAVLASLGTGVALEGITLGIETGEVPFVKTYAATLVALLGFVVAIVAIEYHTLRSHPYYRRPRN